jgi:hypothetical protein
MTTQRFEFVTDTATFCVFDFAALKHRLHDVGDWWSVPSDEVEEVNRGNVAFVGLGADGQYLVRVTDEMPSGKRVSVNLNVPSGRVFIGAGEEVTADGLEPECVRGGAIIVVDPGTYRLLVCRSGEHEIILHLSKHDGSAENAVGEPIHI